MMDRTAPSLHGQVAGHAGPPHIGHYDQLPEYEELLSAGSASLVGRRRDPSAYLKVPLARQMELVALGLEGGRFYVVSTPGELHSDAWYHLVSEGKSRGYTLAGYATAEPEVFKWLHYGREAGADLKSRLASLEDARVIDEIVANSSPLEWFRDVILQCVELGASDVHFELRGPIAYQRVRLDGLMRSVTAYPARAALDGLSAAYTVLAEERSRSEVAFNAAIPQAAMIALNLKPQKLALRYQSHPAVGGLDVVIRILKSGQTDPARPLRLDRLGYTPWQMQRLHEAISSAWGGIFVAGVTGSGKTTTLNTLLKEMARSGSTKLFTIEDPVEYEVPGVTHMSVQRLLEGSANPFHAAMLAFLRMDPDVGLFGEIRDKVSGEMAQAAIQTGHKILSTVHATSALGVVSRLSSESIQLKRQDTCSPEFFSALVYQVLMPVNCEHCREPATRVMSADEIEPYEKLFGLDAATFFCASEAGCPHCRKDGIDYSRTRRNGVKGVKVAAEVILPDMRMLELLQAGRDVEARRHWRARQTTGFDHPDMDGKEAWGHALYDVSQGRIDPFYFERVFGLPSLLASSFDRAG